MTGVIVRGPPDGWRANLYIQRVMERRLAQESEP
jgi:hypothetical protein